VPGDSQGFTEQNHRISRMMEHVNEHHAVETSVLIRDHLAVKLMDRNMMMFTNKNSDSGKSGVRTIARNSLAQQSITAAKFFYGLIVGLLGVLL
jgi:hypothetical protein